MVNIESTNPVNMGSRGQLPLNIGQGYKPNTHNAGVANMATGGVYGPESQANQNNSYNSRPVAEQRQAAYNQTNT
jgi:hypothetical protein